MTRVNDPLLSGPTVNEVLTSLTSYMVAGNCGSAGVVMPENSMKAFQYCIDTGVEAILIPIRKTGSASYIAMKDATLQRTTNYTGNVIDSNDDDLKIAQIDNFTASAQMDKIYIPFLREIFVACERDCIYLLQLQNDLSAADVAEIVGIVEEYNVTDNVIFLSEYATLLDAVLFALPRAKTVLVSAAAPAVLDLVTYWGVQVPYSALTQQNVIDYKTAGKFVGVSDVNFAYIARDFKGYGANWVVSDMPLYIKQMPEGYKTKPFTFDMPRYKYGSGFMNDPLSAPTLSLLSENPRKCGWDTTNESAENLGRDALVLGYAKPDVTTYTLNVTVKFEAEVAGQPAFYAGLYLCLNKDYAYPYWETDPAMYKTSGYSFTLRQNGEVEVNKLVEGVGKTQLVLNNWTPIVLNQEVPIRIDVTPTVITITRTDNNETITFNDPDMDRRGCLGLLRRGHGFSFYNISCA